MSPRFREGINLSHYSEEANVCRDLATDYLNRIAFDRAAPRIKKTLATFKGISQMSSELAKELASLSADQAFLLHTVHGVPSNVFARLGKLRSALPSMPEGPEAKGELVAILEAFGEYVELRRDALLRRLTKVGKGRPDPGGIRNSVQRRLAGSPEDALVRDAWAMFKKFPHLEPNSSEGGCLDEFLGQIHRWATKKPAKTFHKVLLRQVKAMSHDPQSRTG